MFNRTRTLVYLIVCVVGALVVGCASTAAPATPTPVPVPAPATSTPVPVATPLSPAAQEMLKTVRAFEDARKRGDTEALVALIAVAQKETFRGVAEKSAGMGLWYDYSNDCEVKEDRVTCKGVERHKALPCGVSELQVDSAEYVFKDGKIDMVTISLSSDSYSEVANWINRTLLTHTIKNHPELADKYGRMTREGGAIVAEMRKEYCAQQQ